MIRTAIAAFFPLAKLGSYLLWLGSRVVCVVFLELVCVKRTEREKKVPVRDVEMGEESMAEAAAEQWSLYCTLSPLGTMLLKTVSMMCGHCTYLLLCLIIQYCIVPYVLCKVL